LKKETIIAIISTVAIISTIAYSGLNIYAADNLQVRWNSDETFSFYSLSKGQLETCNKFPIPVTFREYNIELTYDETKIGVFRIGSVTVPPFSSLLIDGKLEWQSEIGLTYLLYLDSKLSGAEVGRINVDNLRIVTSIQTSFLGVVPYSISKEYTGYEFVDLMDTKDNNFGC